MTGSADPPRSCARHDQKEIYCRRLGHPLRFRYCRTTTDNRPCPAIADCWFERFDIMAFLHDHLPAETLATLMAPPAPKMVTLLGLIESARRAAD